MPLFGRRSRSLADGGDVQEPSGAKSSEVEDARLEVELAQRAIDVARVEWEESSRELEEARTSMRRTQEEWLETSRMQMESFEEVNQRMFKKSLKRFVKEVNRYSGMRDRVLGKFDRSTDEEILFGDLAESQIEMMDARNAIMRRIGEVQFLWSVAGLDGNPEILEDGFDLVNELDEGIEALADIVRVS